MKRSLHLEGVFKRWKASRIENWHIIQDNIVQITLVDGNQFVFKNLGSRNEDTIHRLHFEHDVLRYVEQSGISVAIPLLSDEGIPYVIDSDQIYRLSKWLPNQPAEVQTSEERIRLYQNFGIAIGRFHQTLADYKDDEILSRTWQTDLQKRILCEAKPVILAHLDQPRLASFQALFVETEPAMTEAFVNLPFQPIIWDCHPGNVAVDGFDVSGFIDCDHISIGPRIFDLANFLVHLIKWDIGDEQKEKIWLAHYRQLVLGYESVCPLSKNERTALFYAMVGIPLIFMGFFFQSGMTELIKVEFDMFDWLVRHREGIIAHLARNQTFGV